MKFYNLNNVITIELFDFEKSSSIFCDTEGYIHFVDNNQYWYPELPDTNIEKENIVYEKPKIILDFGSGVKKYIYFETYQEAKNRCDELTNYQHWIK